MIAYVDVDWQEVIEVSSPATFTQGNAIFQEVGDTGESIIVENTYSYSSKLNHGAQYLAFEFDAYGVPIDSIAANTLSAKNDDGYVDVKIKPNMDTYTNEWNGTLADNTTEQRWLIHDSVNGDRYYENGVFITPTPTMPDTSTTLKLGTTAPIGESDLVDVISQDWKFYLIVKEL